jgi:hypothetical protein
MVLLCFLNGFVMFSYGFVWFCYDFLWFCYVFLWFPLPFSFDLIVKLNPKGTVISGRVGGGINFFNIYWGAIPIGGAALRMVISYWGGGPQ